MKWKQEPWRMKRHTSDSNPPVEGFDAAFSSCFILVVKSAFSRLASLSFSSTCFTALWSALV